MWFSVFYFSYFVSHIWGIPMMKITDRSHLFKRENLHNWWLTKYFFAPLYIYIYIYIYTPAVLNSRPCAPPLCIFCMSLLVNIPESDNHLIRNPLCAWTVFWLACSLHSLHWFPTPCAGKSVEVYFTLERSFMDLLCATSSRTDECDIIYL